MGRLDGKVAVITGAASGIGREAALLFSAEGARVCVADVGQEAGEKTAGECREAFFFKADVSDPASVQRMYAESMRLSDSWAREFRDFLGGTVALATDPERQHRRVEHQSLGVGGDRGRGRTASQGDLVGGAGHAVGGDRGHGRVDRIGRLGLGGAGRGEGGGQDGGDRAN